MGVVLWFGLGEHPSSFDDAYITYRYARNLALGRGFVFNIGDPVLGTTTPLYALLLAGLSLIWSDIPVLSHYIGVLAWALCVPVIYGIGRIGSHETVGIAAAAFIALNPLILGVLGMETALYVLLVLLAFYLYLKGLSTWAAVCAGLAFLTRWDGILVIGVLLFAEMLKHRERFLKMCLVCAAIIVPWLVYSCATFGSIFPNTFWAKMGQGWNEGLGGDEIGTFGRGMLLTAKSAYAENRLFLLLPVFWVIGLFSVFYLRVKWWPILLWTAAYTVGYFALGLLRFPWYYPPLVPGLALLAAQGIESVAQFVTCRLKQRAGQFVVAATFCVLCLIPHGDWLIKSRRTQMNTHSASYVKVGQWLQAHTPPDSSVALLEIGIIGFYSDRTVIDTMGLVSPEMVGHLENWLQTLQFAVNYYWPDYVVTLERTAWSYLVHEQWFEEAYVLETKIENNDDPVAPMSIYRRRSGFPPNEFALNTRPQLQLDQTFVLRRFQVADEHINPGDVLRAQLTWEALTSISTDYRFQFDLLNINDGQRWTLASGLQPMRGGNPTTQWREGDRIVDAYSLQVPADVSVGSYLLQLIVIHEGGHASISDLAGNPEGYIVTGSMTIGEKKASTRDPTHRVTALFADSIRLVGYDLSGMASSNILTTTLYWKATGTVSRDYTVFVHLFSPEGELVAQHDSPPLLPTSLWVSDTTVIDIHTLALPTELSPVDYEIRVGLYHWPDLERVPIVDSGDLDEADNALLLMTVHFDTFRTP
jgi:hypothetical protein